MTTEVQKLTDSLLGYVDEERNVSNLAGAFDVIKTLETVQMTKTLLEKTRIGLLINDIRKKTVQTYPELSQQCRALIKSWQSLAKGSQPNSNSTSRSGTPATPFGISPAVRSRLTPTGNSGNSSQKTKPISPLVTGSGVKSRPVTPANTIRSTNTTPSPRPLPNGAPAPHSQEKKGEWFSDSYAPGGGNWKERDSVGKSSSVDSSHSAGSTGIKLKIKLASDTGIGSTTIVRTISPDVTVNREQAENRRKRKLEEELAPKELGTGRNGISSPPEIQILDVVATEPQKKRGRPPKNKQPSPVNQQNTLPAPSVPALPGRAPKLKSTQEYLDKINMSLPEEMAITLEAPPSTKEVTESPEVGSSEPEFLDSTLDSTDFSEHEQEQEMELRRKRGRPRKDGMNYYFVPVEYGKKKKEKIKRTASAEDVKRGKSVLVQKFLDSTAAEVIVEESEPSTSALPAGLAKSFGYKSSPALNLMDRDSPETVEEEFPRNEPKFLTEDPKIVTEELPKKQKNWYDCLPPLDSKILKEVTSAYLVDQEEIGLETGNFEEREFLKTDDVTINRKEPSVKDSRSRFLRAERGREVLGMPLVDIGLPDFLEYKFPDKERYLSEMNFVFRPPGKNFSGSDVKSGTATPNSSMSQ